MFPTTFITTTALLLSFLAATHALPTTLRTSTLIAAHPRKIETHRAPASLLGRHYVRASTATIYPDASPSPPDASRSPNTTDIPPKRDIAHQLPGETDSGHLRGRVDRFQAVQRRRRQGLGLGQAQTQGDTQKDVEVGAGAVASLNVLEPRADDKPAELLSNENHETPPAPKHAPGEAAEDHNAAETSVVVVPHPTSDVQVVHPKHPKARGHGIGKARKEGPRVQSTKVVVSKKAGAQRL